MFTLNASLQNFYGFNNRNTPKWSEMSLHSFHLVAAE